MLVCHLSHEKEPHTIILYRVFVLIDVKCNIISDFVQLEGF